ncbi:MAG TPA: cytochrome b/b6 domain-containing protein [Nitrospirae bacterium]|nr:cytochrome b/b6 domain-containing protein [Nitrospirota bacterium]
MKNQKNKSLKEIPEEVERFNIIFRIQHVIMFTTFLLLAFTGWGLKFAGLEISSWWIRIWGGAKTAGIIHRVAGVTMILDFAFHVLYVGYLLITGKMQIRTVTTIIPLPKDVKDVVHNFLYFLGIAKTKPKFGRFSYAQKFDYWAVFWGMFIIGLSGLALAFPIQASHLIPEWSTGWIWQLIAILHSDEALLAIVFILFWHFYNEHLKPEVFPMSWVWLTGKIPVKELKQKHPLEYELMFKEEPESREDHNDSPDDSSGEEKGD